MSAPSIELLGAQYREAMRVKGEAAGTLEHKELALRRFSQWCAERGLENIVDITRPMIERYQRWLFNYRRDDGKPLTVATQYNHLSTLKKFFSWLVRQGLVLHNATSELELPKLPKRLPRNVLTSEEAERLLQHPDTRTDNGLRDRVALEVLYSTGIRRKELVGLSVGDFNFARGTVHIRFGKNNKDRVIPIGERALKWVQKYLDEVRPKLARLPDDGQLLLGERGQPYTLAMLSAMVRRHLDGAGVYKGGACHVLRHTMATLMLEGGADIRYIQQMLGHTLLNTTEVYTRVAIGKLKEVHTNTHPGANLTGPRKPSGDDDSSS